MTYKIYRSPITRPFHISLEQESYRTFTDSRILVVHNMYPLHMYMLQYTVGCVCLGGGRLGFFSLATAATCELMAFMNPVLSVIPNNNSISYYDNTINIT